MRIAVCLSGQPRGLPFSLDLFKWGLLDKNDNIDIFIHSWFDKSIVGNKFDSAQPDNFNATGTAAENTDSLLKSICPKGILLESPKDFNEFGHLKDLGTARQKSLASMFYSSFKSNELKRKYEEDNKFTYDLVIKTRIDLQYSKQVVLSDLPISKIQTDLFVPQKHHHTRVSDSYPTKTGFNYSSMSDTWILGSSQNIDIAASVFCRFEEIYNDIYPYAYGEAYLGYVVRGLGKIPISMIDVDYNIYRPR